MRKRQCRLLLPAVCLAAGLAGAGCGEDGRRSLTLGIPTTVQDSGLLDVLLPEFEAAFPEYRVKFIAAGSGELLLKLLYSWFVVIFYFCNIYHLP